MIAGQICAFHFPFYPLAFVDLNSERANNPSTDIIHIPQAVLVECALHWPPCRTIKVRTKKETGKIIAHPRKLAVYAAAGIPHDDQPK